MPKKAKFIAIRYFNFRVQHWQLPSLDTYGFVWPDWFLACYLRMSLSIIVYKQQFWDYTPPPFLNENGSTGPDSNFNVKSFGDMFSTLYNWIWSSANSFFRNNWARPFFACLLEHWLTYSPQCSFNWSVLQNLILNLNMEQKIKHKFFMLLCKKMKNKGISKIEFWPI